MQHGSGRNPATQPRGESSFQTGSDLESALAIQDCWCKAPKLLGKDDAFLCSQNGIGGLSQGSVLCSVLSFTERQGQTALLDFSTSYDI